MKPKNRFGLPVQSGEFIDVQNGEAHVISYVETWEDAPAGSSGYREVNLYGMTMPLADLQAVVRHFEGFAELESRYKQGIAAEPLEQDAFDCDIDFNENAVARIISTNEFLRLKEDGYYFVQYAEPVLTRSQRAIVLAEWRASGAEEPSSWLPAFLENRPWLDAPWLISEILTLVAQEMRRKLNVEHFNDGLVDVRNVDEFCLVVFTNIDGKTETVGYDNNFFTPKDLLEAYGKVFDDGWGDDKASRLAVFKEYLVATGCPKEDLEDE